MALPLSLRPKHKGINGKGDKPGMKNNGKEEINRILITLNVVGSAGPFRLVVREDELVSSVIDTLLKTYAREGRRPVLGSDLNCFALYCAYNSFCALSPWEQIGSFGCRNFLLCMKQSPMSEISATPGREIRKKAMTGWKAWLNRSIVTKFVVKS
ncbi:hypothetical protein KSP40_PGU018658 [Platanthera guangdongensis]|uniref:DUF7054 domain-containing protein n=1 Tax=Platanthera guangdongensis TaxID=2320717 RepID=A0ABR2M268_9ASPA